MSRTKRKVNDVALSKKTSSCGLPIWKHPPIGCEGIFHCPLEQSVSFTAKPAWRRRLHHNIEPVTAASVISNNKSRYFLGNDAPTGGPLVVTIGTGSQVPSEVVYDTVGNAFRDNLDA